MTLKVERENCLTVKNPSTGNSACFMRLDDGSYEIIILNNHEDCYLGIDLAPDEARKIKDWMK